MTFVVLTGKKIFLDIDTHTKFEITGLLLNFKTEISYWSLFSGLTFSLVAVK